MVEFKAGELGRLEKKLKKIAAKAEGSGATLEVGFMNRATEADGTPVALVAALNEFGHTAPNGTVVPPRPFFRRTIAKRKDAWKHNLGVALVAQAYDLPKALAMLGQGVADDVQQGIRDLVSPPLAPSTVARKGFDKPLIETATMLNSVTFNVKE